MKNILNYFKKIKFERKIKKNKNIKLQYQDNDSNITFELITYTNYNNIENEEDYSVDIKGEEIKLHKRQEIILEEDEDIDYTNNVYDYKYIQDRYKRFIVYTYHIYSTEEIPEYFINQLYILLKQYDNKIYINSKNSILISISINDIENIEKYCDQFLEDPKVNILKSFLIVLKNNMNKSSLDYINNLDYEDELVNIHRSLYIDLKEAESINNIKNKEYKNFNLDNNIYEIVIVKNYLQSYNIIIDKLISKSYDYINYFDMEENTNVYEIIISINNMKSLIKEIYQEYQMQRLYTSNIKDLLEHLNGFYNIKDQELNSNIEDTYVEELDPYDDIDEIIQ